jgi:AcrR family transcriptional regulator
LKKKGRPPNTSREEILSVALDLLSEGGENGLSIRKLAKLLEVAPSSIYNYFSGKDELLNALAEYGLEAIPDLPEDGSSPWDDQVTRWMNTFRLALLEAPELQIFISLAAKSPSVQSILDKIKSIAAILRMQGMDEVAAVHHAQGIVWTVMSFTYFETLARSPSIVEGIRSAGQLENYSEVTAYFAVDNYDELWAETVKRNIEGIRVQFQSSA